MRIPHQWLRIVPSSDLFSVLNFYPSSKDYESHQPAEEVSYSLAPSKTQKNPETQKDLIQPKSALPTSTPNTEFYSSVDDLSQSHKGSLEHQQNSATGDSILPCGNKSKSISLNSGVKSGRTEARSVDPIAFLHKSYLAYVVLPVVIL